MTFWICRIEAQFCFTRMVTQHAHLDRGHRAPYRVVFVRIRERQADGSAITLTADVIP
jgi:hypothetical protein